MNKDQSDCSAEVSSLPQPSLPPLPTSIALDPTPGASGYNVARSPSHESFATDLSLMSLSSLGSEMGRMRGQIMRSRTDSSGDGGGDSGDERRSPVMMEGAVGGWATRSARFSRSANTGLLQVPHEHFGTKRSLADDVLYEEETEAIRNCGALSSMLGLMRSFSTNDLYQGNGASSEQEILHTSVSETVLNSWKQSDRSYGKLEYTSRSCSTWVAVGDISTTSQLPSPQTLAGYAAEHPEMSAIDFILAINKKVRQMYIRRRLESTYKALERLTRSELCLDIPSLSAHQPAINKSSPASADDAFEPKGATSATLPKNVQTPRVASSPLPQFHISTELDRSIRQELQISSLGFRGANKTLSLTVKDIEREKGKSLSKYERNMMIFNWLQSLDETTFD